MNFFFMWYTRRWNDRTCSTLCCSNAGRVLSRGFRLSKYSMASSSVGVANGPRRMAASISGQESLWVTVTIDCISPNSESSDMAKRSRCCFFHLIIICYIVHHACAAIIYEGTSLLTQGWIGSLRSQKSA